MTTISTITELSTPVPQTSDPDNFDERADTLFTELPVMVTEFNTTIGQTNTVANEVEANKAAAETAQANAEAAQAAAENASNASLYSISHPGGYSVGDVVYGTDGMSRRCIQNQAQGAVQPLEDVAYWCNLLPQELLDLQQQSIDQIINAPGYFFDGVDDTIVCPDDINNTIGLNDFSVVISIYDLQSTYQFLSKWSPGYFINWHKVYIYDGSSYLLEQEFPDIYQDKKSHILSWSLDRSDNSKIFLDTELVSTVDVSSWENSDLQSSGPLCIGSRDTVSAYSQSTINSVSLFNLALDETDPIDKAIINGGHIPYVYQGASNTELTSGTLIQNKKYLLKDWETGDDFTNIGAASNADGIEFIATGTTPTTWTNGSKVIQIGCVADYSPSGVGHNTWIDNSGNGNHGQVSGAAPISIPANHTEFYSDTITNDTSFTLPAGYLIDAITLTSTGSIGGGLDIGTTNGGGEIVSAQAVSAGTVNCTIVNGKHYNTTGADDTIYITDADGTGWDGASVDIQVSMKRMEVI